MSAISKQPDPVFIREQESWSLRYETVSEETGIVIATTTLKGSLTEILLKVISAHRNVTLFAERLRAKLADLQVENSRK